MGAFRSTVAAILLLGVGFTIIGVDLWRNKELHNREALISAPFIIVGLVMFVPSQAKDAFSFLFGWVARGWIVWRKGRVIDNETLKRKLGDKGPNE